jgi:choline/glycine/proline betaine transport protein
LLIGGGLTALQTASISTGLPFVLILLVMCYSLYQGLQKEYEEEIKRGTREFERNYEKLVRETIDKHLEEQQEEEQS